MTAPPASSFRGTAIGIVVSGALTLATARGAETGVSASVASPVATGEAPAGAVVATDGWRGIDLGRISSGLYLGLFAGSDRVRTPLRVATRTVALATAGELDPNIGPNLRLADDPAALPATMRAQAEPHLARSVTNTNLLVATFQEGRYVNGGAVNCGYSVSVDGGVTWSRGLIPHLVSAIDDGPFTRASDPVAGVGLDGAILLNTLGIMGTNGPFQTTILLSKSTDGGRTFDPPLTVLTNSLPEVMLDKNWMAVNTFPDTRTAGRICVTYTRFDTTQGQVNPIYELHSDDGGTAWSVPRSISPAICQGSQPVFLPDGTLAVVYWNFAGSNGQRIEVAVSPDGGDAPFTRRVVTDVPTPFDDVQARDGGFLPSAAADRTLGVVYVAYQARTNTVPRILFTRSADQGNTWTPPLAVSDSPGGASVFNAAIAASPDGQHVTVIFYDKRNDDSSGYLYDLYLAESFDGGDTWQPNRRLSSTSSDLRDAPLTPAGRMVGDYQAVVPALNLEDAAWAIWVDTRTGSPDPFVTSVRRTQGSRFEAWRRLAFSAAELADPSVSDPTADPDHDLVPNAFEYVGGRDPRRPDGPAFQARAAGDPASAPLAVEYRVSRMATDATVQWIESADLQSWSPASPIVEEVASGDPSQRAFRARFPTAAPVGFQRASVTLSR